MGANGFHSGVESEESDVEGSDTEYAEVTRSQGSKMEMPHSSDDSDWQQCDSEVAIKNHHRQKVNSQNQNCQSGQTLNPQRHHVNSMKNRNREVLKSVRQTNGLANDHSSRPMFKRKERTAHEDISTSRYRPAIRAGMRSVSDARPSRVTQSNTHTNRFTMTGREGEKTRSSADTVSKEYNSCSLHATQRRCSSYDKSTESCSDS